MGRLGGISCVHVNAGDSIDLDMTSIINMSPFRRQLTVDARLDTFAFFQSYEKVYGDDWKTFIESGTDESVTFTGDALTGSLYFTGIADVMTGTIPKWVLHMINNVWNYYFRIPSVTAEKSLTAEPAAGDEARYGYAVPHLPSYLTASDSYQEITTADYQLSTGGTLDIIDLAQLRARS